MVDGPEGRDRGVAIVHAAIKLGIGVSKPSTTVSGTT